MTVTGTVAWFDLTKRFGFVALEGGHGDAFLHMPVLKDVRRHVKLDQFRMSLDKGGRLCLASPWHYGAGQDRAGSQRRVAEVLEIDTSTARPGENEGIRRKPKT